MPQQVIHRFLLAIVTLAILSHARCFAGDSYGPTYTEKRPIKVKPFSLVTDDAVGKRLMRVADLINGGHPDKARALLQEVLDLKTDPLVLIRRSVDANEETWEYIHASLEAVWMLRRIHRSQNKDYQAKQDAEAEKLLGKATDEKSRELLIQVAHRYPYTDAAEKALKQLAGSLAESGDYVAAAIYYQRLSDDTPIRQWDGASLFHATVAFRRAGKTGYLPDTAWHNLQERLKDGPLELGNRKLKLDDVEKEIKARTHREAEPLELVTGFGGSPRRTAQGYGGAPRLDKPDWSMPLVREEAVRKCLTKYQDKQFEDKLPVLPGSFAVTGNSFSVPVVIYPSASGLHAIDAQSGKLKWEADLEWSPDRIARLSFNRWLMCEQWMEGTPKSRNALPWENFLAGSLSREGKNVYAIEDFHVLPPNELINRDNSGRLTWLRSVDPLLVEGLSRNSIRCYDLRSGKIIWRLGGGENDTDTPKDLQGSFFLSAPLEVGGKLYVMNEKDLVIRLLCFDIENAPPNKTPAVLWQIDLGETGHDIRFEPERHIQAAHISYDDGILVCQTNTGAVLGVEPVSRMIVWAYIYRGVEEPKPKVDPDKAPPPAGRWRHSAPMIQDGKVIVAPPDVDTLFCLSLRDGSVVWEVPRAEEDLYVAGIFADKVLVVGTKSVKAYNLADGKPAWKELAIGMPSGQGTASKNVYYLPLRYAGEKAKEGKPEICTIDIVKGTLTAHMAWNDDEAPGNLLFFSDHLISQSIFNIRAYPLEKDR